MVVANTRDKRNGKVLDILGFYNPSKNPAELKIDDQGVKNWKNKGAMVSKAVEDLMAGTYKFVKYSPRAEAVAEKTEENKE